MFKVDAVATKLGKNPTQGTVPEKNIPGSEEDIKAMTDFVLKKSRLCLTKFVVPAYFGLKTGNIQD